MKEVYAYIRVSTVRQGERGSSLQEQHDSIVTYARRHDLNITTWFEEMETAAKSGRGEFTRMLSLLTKGKACGVILHKIDRGARNLKDWANLRELTERGVDVHLAHESIDLRTRSGALMADIQAVFATDYIRNLRDEVRKGIYGRLKQGIYPFGAPLGYLDRGGGKPKEPDPERAPFVRTAFELYATGAYNLRTLRDELYRLGLRTKVGHKTSKNRLNEILRDPFYIGIIKIKRTGEVFAGIHQPLIPKSLFDRVQALLRGKANTRSDKHAFAFRRLVKCRECGRSLTGERQKGFVYYRCHSAPCRAVCIREDELDCFIRRIFAQATLSAEEYDTLQAEVLAFKSQWSTHRESSLQALDLTSQNLGARLSRLTDAFLDGSIEREIYDERKRALLMEQVRVEEQRAALKRNDTTLPDQLSELFEQTKTLSLSYEKALPQEKRELVSALTSNFCADGKNVVVELRSPYREIAMRSNLTSGGPFRDRLRTETEYLKGLLVTIVDHFSAEQEHAHDAKM